MEARRARLDDLEEVTLPQLLEGENLRRRRMRLEVQQRALPWRIASEEEDVRRTGLVLAQAQRAQQEAASDAWQRAQSGPPRRGVAGDFNTFAED